MRHFTTRLKKLEEIMGKAFILYTHPYESTADQAHFREQATRHYLEGSGNENIQRVYVEIVDFSGNKKSEVKWHYSS